jgi:hypothetical protein
MSDETSKAEEPKQSNEQALTDQDLEKVAGGVLATPTKPELKEASDTLRSGQMADVNFGGVGT